MKNPLRATIAFLGIYAGLIAIQHGIFEIMQGSRAPDGLMFNAIGPPCQPEAVWHACFPAMTLIPNLLVTGIAAIVIGTTLLLWALFFVQRRYGGWILAILSILLLLVGGGFVPVFIGMVAAIASRGLEHLLTDASLHENMLRLKALQDRVDGPAIAAREIVNFLGASNPNVEAAT